MQYDIYKYVLENGLTVLLCRNAIVPKVAVQLWYHVGSKDEKDGQRGLAHLLEHMIFKGTDLLSESDINLITHKLSGSCNAFTSHDYTGYIFDFPKQHWDVALPLLANCMTECTFKEDLLNAELKAVIQELKMYKDDYVTSISEELMGSLFKGHPYHYPIIGFKQDLWHITRKGLLDFYHQHYLPNNATLVIVGDITVDEALQKVQNSFGSIKPNWSYKKEAFCYHPDIKSEVITMQRDVQQPLLIFGWAVPGARESAGATTEIVRWIIGEGRGSRLYKKLVNEKELATDIQVDFDDLFDRGILLIHIDPIDEDAICEIKNSVKEELAVIGREPLLPSELIRAKKQAELEHLSIYESNQKIAYELGKRYLSTGKLSLAQNYMESTEADVQLFVQSYLRPSCMYTGIVLPFATGQQELWLSLQEDADREDQKILSRKVRESAVECGSFVQCVAAMEPAPFEYPYYKKFSLANDLNCIWYSVANFKKITLILDFATQSWVDPEDKQGLTNFLFQMLLEGTNSYSAQEFADLAESRGIGIDVRPGSIILTTLKDQLSFALNLLAQMVMHAAFHTKEIEKVRSLICADIEQLWDQPLDFAAQLAKEAVYQAHPYAKNPLGTLDAINQISQSDLKDAYKRIVVPQGSRLVLVGDMEGIDGKKMVEETFGAWSGQSPWVIDFPIMRPLVAHTIEYPIQRDQTVLGYTGISIPRLDHNYDALILFEYILTGGSLGSMSSILFQLREQTGLFYTIGGSLTLHSDEQPGIIFLRTIVSNDSLDQAERLIEKTLTDSSEKITQEDLDHAVNAIVNSLVDNFESSYGSAQMFLFLDRFNLGNQYLFEYIKRLKKISLSQVKEVAKEFLSMKKMVKIKIGRTHAELPK